VLGPRLLDATISERLVSQAQGNPFFLEELARSVVEQGEGMQPQGIPETIQSVLAARIDRLLPAAKRFLQTAAVVGAEVRVSLLRALVDYPQEALDESLVSLQSGEFLYQSQVLPESTYTFNHVLTREMASQTLLRRARQQLHAHIAQVLTAQFPESAESQPEVLAHHYTEAQLPEPALPYWQRAGQRAA